MAGKVCAYACLVAAIFATATTGANDEEEPPATPLLQQQRPDIYVDTDTDYLGDYAVYPGVSNEDFAVNRNPQSVAGLYASADTADNSNAVDDGIGVGVGVGAGDGFNERLMSSDGNGDEDLAGRSKRRMNSFIRLGRDQQKLKLARSFIRLGRAHQQPSRLDNFMRFGRAGSARKAGSSFVRFGRGGEEDFPEAMRFIRRGDSFIRFGKRSESADGLMPMRVTRSNVGNGLMIQNTGERGRLAGGQATSDEINRIERNGKQFIRFGRRDDSFVRLGKKKSIGTETEFYKTLMANSSNNVDSDGSDGGNRVADELPHAHFV